MVYWNLLVFTFVVYTFECHSAVFTAANSYNKSSRFLGKK